MGKHLVERHRLRSAVPTTGVTLLPSPYFPPHTLFLTLFFALELEPPLISPHAATDAWDASPKQSSGAASALSTPPSLQRGTSYMLVHHSSPCELLV
ncbi:hypothetical protein LSTR_LSTR010854 [Laodelphax striatellus]|uniref:Uncharacterized protein n=1 Tax=Laodelphax striatellus TaxID=195883 RepID=A0A482WSB1_LAOST|nr:hypothetical protein LSTR_LSTR010854 [Laodelphax striatellus]